MTSFLQRSRITVDSVPRRRRGTRDTAERHRGLRADYDAAEQAFRIYRGKDRYCSMIARYTGAWDTVEVVDEALVVIRWCGDVVATFTAFGEAIP